MKFGGRGKKENDRVAFPESVSIHLKKGLPLKCFLYLKESSKLIKSVILKIFCMSVTDLIYCSQMYNS